MKKFIYRVVALIWLITHLRKDMCFPLNKKGNRYAFHPKDGDIKLLDFAEILDYVVEDQLIDLNWWDVITSDEVDLWTAPWRDSMSYLFLAKIDHGIDLGDLSMSEHHRLWR